MRSIAEITEEQNRIAKRAQELELERRAAEEDARSPRKLMIRRRYEVIQKMLDQLDQLGEHVTDGEGYALHIKGRTFEINPTTGVQEV